MLVLITEDVLMSKNKAIVHMEVKIYRGAINQIII